MGEETSVPVSAPSAADDGKAVVFRIMHSTLHKEYYTSRNEELVPRAESKEGVLTEFALADLEQTPPATKQLLA